MKNKIRNIALSVAALGAVLLGGQAFGVNIIGFQNGGASTRTPAQALGNPTKSISVIEGAHTEIATSTAWESILFDLSSIKTWNQGAITEQGAISIKAPTYAFDDTSTITGAGTMKIDKSPQAGTNGTISYGTNLLLGEIVGTQTNADSDHSLLVVVPGITNGINNVTARKGIQVFASPAASVDLGNTTSTLTDFAGLEFGTLNLTSDTNQRTVTNAATVVINKAPENGGNVVFTNGPYSLWIRADASRFDGRVMPSKGSDVASANDITLGDGNYFDITGTTQINTISATNWVAGSLVVLQFDGSVTVKHATSGTGAQLNLAASGDFAATTGDTLMVIYDGSVWREVSRTAI